ncbi:hypothetical protein IM543_10545 [Massilia sp. UMI-21]|nr:hypothetical protein IM543_10545 [Massilia sp. UMI-21]
MSLFDFLRRPPSPRGYAALLLKKLAIHHPGEAVRFDEEGFRLLLGADGGHAINLHTLYAEYCAAGKPERARQLERVLSLIERSELPASFADVRARLMPVLRGRGLAEYLRLMALDKDPQAASAFLFRPFSSDTILTLMVDSEQSMQSFRSDQLAQWGVSSDEALAAAMDNLRDATVDRFIQVERGVFAGDWGDAYDSSRLLLPDLAHRIAGANPLAMVPARGTLLLASGKDIEAVRAMVALARRIADTETRPVSALMYRYENGRAVAHVPDDASVRSGLESLGRQYLFGDYAAQKETLDALYEKSGTDVFVASYKVMRDPARDIEYSMCSWTRGVDALLPRTDRVALVDLDGDQMQELIIVSWDALQAAFGQLIQALPDAWPQRYRVTGFPDLERARAIALPAQP